MDCGAGNVSTGRRRVHDARVVTRIATRCVGDAQRAAYSVRHRFRPDAV
jgi:hypothetical protein